MADRDRRRAGMTGRKYLGLDLGSVSLDAVVVDDSATVLWSAYRAVQGRARDAVASLCDELTEGWLRPRSIAAFDGATATGSGKELIQELLAVPVVNEIVSHGTAAALFAAGAASVIEIGGQDSKFILVDGQGVYDYSMNALCAAGTGAFLDVQAERLGLSIEEFSALAATAARVPPLAGRCSVFAKSDIIHLQQRGVPVDQIAAGLCHALARNYVATLIRGRALVKPVVFQGGVALNDGVLRAFREILRLADAEALRPPSPHLSGALGAALLSRNSGAPLDARVIAGAAAAHPATTGREPRGAARGWRVARGSDGGQSGLESFERFGAAGAGALVYIGLDIGSVSTKAVALSAAGDLLAAVYLLTAGKPLAAAKRALDGLAEPIRGATIAAVGVTGSGRKLVGHAVGADLVIDEITAQARGACHGSPDADTVIEIGGQDAKFIRVGGDGEVVDFEMNKVCAAGTGSFIQEQAVRLGVDLKEEYDRLALGSSTPLPFTSRCTVFMESDLVHHVQQGVSLPDLLMGVSHAVVENYLDRVVQGRRLGSRVVLQGGVAKNASVVAAFRKRLGEAQVAVHPHPGVSGAIGVALLTVERRKRESAGREFATSFKGLDFSIDYQSGDFTCKGCENRCEVSVFQFAQGRFHFGDLCGKYSEAVSGLDPGRDLTPGTPAPAAEADGIATLPATIGIPQALLYQEFFPFWRAFFSELGIRLQLSGPSSGDKLTLALSRLAAETCLPVKLLFGQVASLEDQGIDSVFVPSTSRLLDGVSCPYVQHAAAMVQAGFDGLRVVTLPLVPGLTEKEKERLALKGAELLAVARESVLAAYETAAAAFDPVRRAWCREARPSGVRPLAVLIGKPYNTADRFVNMSLAAKLAKAGFDVAAAEQLVIPEDLPLPRGYESLTWTFGRRMLKIAAWIGAGPDLYPVVVGNFGCGPDSFTFPLLEELFAERPCLFLEFDEHRADAGLDTRVEAFAHRVARWRTRGERRAAGAKRVGSGPGEPPPAAGASPSDEDTEYIIPYFSDHACAYAGAFGGKGIGVRVLPLPDHRSYQAGVEMSGGKQCHPFQLIAGDLINLARSGALSRGARYVVPRVESTCMITQYIPTIQRYMDRLGRGDVRVISSDSLELLQTFGPLFMYNLGKAILGIEYLGRLRYEMRPYEIDKGVVDSVYAAGLETIRLGQLEDRVNQGILDAALALASVPTGPRGTRPVIAITGDAYTRINQAANGGLFEMLEELGCEVWPSPTMVDIIMTGPEMYLSQHWEDGRLRDMMSSWGWVLVHNLAAGAVLKSFEGLLTNFTEPHADDVLKYTDGLLPGEPELLVTLNVAKHVDFANKGVDGILNVYCLNCLVGTATTAIFRRLAGRTFGVPMMPLVFDTVGGTHVRNRVEAFVHRVKRNREERPRPPAGGDAEGARGFAGGSVARLKELFDQRLFDVRLPSVRLPEITMPRVTLPELRLPASVREWSMHRGRNGKDEGGEHRIRPHRRERPPGGEGGTP